MARCVAFVIAADDANPDAAEGVLHEAVEAAEAAGMRASKVSGEAVVGRAGDAPRAAGLRFA